MPQEYCGAINPPPPGGGTGSSQSCGPSLSCIESNRPRGRLGVFDTQLGCQPFVNTKVICKNWFKGIRRSRHLYTDNQGMFTATQRFKRVKVKVKFRNAGVSIRPMRVNIGIRLSLFNLQTAIGVYRNGCEMNTIDYLFNRGNDRNSREFMFWLGAHAINAKNYQTDNALLDELKTMEGHRLIVYLCKESQQDDSRPYADITLQNYLWKTKGVGAWTFDVAKLAFYVKFAKWGSAVSNLINLVLGSQKPDILYNYNTPWINLSSNEVNQQFYYAYTMPGIIKYAGTDNWKYYFKAKSKFFDAIAGVFGSGAQIAYKEIKAQGSSFDISKPEDVTSLALNVFTFLQAWYYSSNMPDKEFYDQFEGFSNYYGHFLADRKYGTNADAIKNQNFIDIPSAGGWSSHKIFLEYWTPNLNYDVYRYTKLGIFHDLYDTDIDQIPPTYLPDNASNVKQKNMFYAISGYGSGNIFIAPTSWNEFKGNIAAPYHFSNSTQFNNIINLCYAYQIP